MSSTRVPIFQVVGLQDGEMSGKVRGSDIHEASVVCVLLSTLQSRDSGLIATSADDFRWTFESCLLKTTNRNFGLHTYYPALI